MISGPNAYGLSNYCYSVKMIFLSYLHLKNLMEGCFESHKRLSLNETIRMIAEILILFHYDYDSIPYLILYSRIVHYSSNDVS